MSQSERFEVGQKKNVEIIFLVNLRLSFSETIESPDSSISYLLRSLKIESVTLTYISMVTLTVEILQDLVLHLPFKSVIVFTFNSFLYYIPVIQKFFFYIDFQSHPPSHYPSVHETWVSGSIAFFSFSRIRIVLVYENRCF